MEFLAKTLILSTTTALAGLNTFAQINPVETGEKLGALGTSAILGIVSVVSVIALVRLYRDKEKSAEENSKKLIQIIEASTAAAQANAETNRVIAGILVEMKNTIKGCENNKS